MSESGNTKSRFSRPIRALHALTALLIVTQLLISLVMDHPHRSRPMRPSGALYFEWHTWVGLAALAVLALGVLYRVVRWRSELQARMFPWVARGGRSALAAEIRDFLSLRWTRVPEEGALAGTVQGLGLLIALAMAFTGGALYILLGPDNTVTGSSDKLGDVHSFLSNFMWAYLWGHTLMALWHEYMGHRSVRNMFTLS